MFISYCKAYAKYNETKPVEIALHRTNGNVYEMANQLTMENLTIE